MNTSTVELIVLIVIFLLTSVVGVVTGSNSLIAVPAMFQVGIDEKVAIATNMFGLTFMAVGGTIPFLRQGKIEAEKLTPLIVLTLIGSALGALLVGYITNQSIKLIVSVSMFVVVVFSFVRTQPKEGSKILWVGYIASFLLAIYGGLYSGSTGCRTRGRSTTISSTSAASPTRPPKRASSSRPPASRRSSSPATPSR
jgi:hypothetical protein